MVVARSDAGDAREILGALPGERLEDVLRRRTELFQARTRASGASLAYQISAMVSGFTPFVTTLLFVSFGWMGPAMLFGLYAAVGLWAAVVTRETWGKQERRLADEITKSTPQSVNA